MKKENSLFAGNRMFLHGPSRGSRTEMPDQNYKGENKKEWYFTVKPLNAI